MVADDVEIEIPKVFRDKHKYAYLAVFNNKNWIPVQYGKVKGKKVRFTAMGRNCMYMPVFYDEDRIVPFSSPFYLSPKGIMQWYETGKPPEPKVRTTIILFGHEGLCLTRLRSLFST